MILKNKLFLLFVILALCISDWPAAASNQQFYANCCFDEVYEENNVPDGWGMYKIQGSYPQNTVSYKGGLGGKYENDYAACITAGRNVNLDVCSISAGTQRITRPFTAEMSVFVSEKAGARLSMVFSGQSSPFLYFTNTGDIKIRGKRIGSFENNRWYNAAIEFKQGLNIVDVYINGVLCAENIELSSSQNSYIQGLYLCVESNAIFDCFAAYDNVRIYDGGYSGTVRNDVDEKYFFANDSVKVNEISEYPVRVFSDNALTVSVDDEAHDGDTAAIFCDERIIIYKKIADISVYTPYELTNDAIRVPNGITAEELTDNIIASGRKSVLDGACEVTGRLSTGMMLRIESKSGYIRRYRIEGPSDTEISDELISYTYKLEGDILKDIPKETSTNLLHTVLLKENPGIDIDITEQDGKTPVRAETVNDTMKIIAGGRIYGIKAGRFADMLEDFESVSEGVFSKTENIQAFSGVSGYVYADVSLQGGSKVLNMHLSSDYSDKNVYVQTEYFNLEGAFSVGFRFKTDSGSDGELRVFARDENTAPNGHNLELIKVTKGRVCFFAANEYKAVSVDDGWHTAYVNVDTNIGIAQGFCDGEVVGEINFKSYVPELDFKSCMIRVFATTLGESAVCSIDDWFVIKNMTGNIVAKKPQLFCEGETGEREELRTLYDGSFSIQTELAELNNVPQNAYLIAALYNNGKLRRTYAVNTLEGPVLVDGYIYNEGDEIKIFVFDSLNGIKPLREYTRIFRNNSQFPNKVQLRSMFKGKEGVHPRIMADAENFDRIRSFQGSDETVSRWCTDVLTKADIIAQNITDDASSPYGIAYVKSSTDQILTISRRVKDFAAELGMAYRLTGDKKYSDAVWKILSMAGKPTDEYPQSQFPDWNSTHFLDTAEMASGFAIGYDWCFDAFSEEQRQYIENSILEYGINYANSENKTYVWYKTDRSNWNAVCSGGMLTAALAVCDVYPEESFLLTEDCLNNFKYILSEFYPDGSWHEGIMYGLYTMQYYTKAIAALKTVFGTDFGLLDIKGAEKLTDYFVYMDGPMGANNYSDSDTVHITDASILYLSDIFRQPDYTGWLKNNMRKTNTSATALHLLWYNPEYASCDFVPQSGKYFARDEVAALGGYDADDDWLSFIAGTNMSGHSHLDSGAFVYDSKGVRWAMDLGQENYSSAYFGEGRYNYYRTRAEGHNTLVINPDAGGGQIKDSYAKITEYSAQEGRAVTDLSKCYSDNAYSVRREFDITDGELLIKDSISLKQDCLVYWFMHTKTSAEVLEDQSVILTASNGIKKRLTVTCSVPFEIRITDAAPLTAIDDISIEGCTIPSNQSTNRGVRKIMIKLIGSGDVNISVSITDYIE